MICIPSGTRTLSHIGCPAHRLLSALAAACVLAVPACAQNTGVARPAPAVFTPAPDDIPVVALPPAAPTSLAPATIAPAYAPYTAAAITTPARRPLIPADPDAGIVTSVPTIPGELSDGTLLHAALREPLSTLTTRPGSRFSAELSEPVTHDGQVIFPAGAILEGRVTWLRSGRRISGAAAIHLEPQAVLLPDGVRYPLHARVIDTTSWNNTRVDSEGTITRRDHTKGTTETFGLVAGSSAAAGAMIAGVPGALVGAGIGTGMATVVWLKEDRQAELPRDLGLIFSLTAPIAVNPASASAPTFTVVQPAGE